MSVVTVLVAWQRYNLRWPLLPINLPPDSKAGGINNCVTRGVRNPELLQVTARFYCPPCPQRSKKFAGPEGKGELKGLGPLKKLPYTLTLYLRNVPTKYCFVSS